MKKNTIKLKELSALQKNSDNEGEIRTNVRFVAFCAQKCPEEGQVSPEGLVERPKPTCVAAGTEEDEPQKCQAKVGRTASSCPPCDARHHIHTQRDGVHCTSTGKTHQVSPGTPVHNVNIKC